MLQSLCDRDTERGDLITSDFTWLNPKVTSYLPKVVMATCVVVKIEDQKFFGVDNRSSTVYTIIVKKSRFSAEKQ